MSALSDAESVAHDTAKSKPVELLGRVGLVAYGAVHLLIAGLLVQIPFGEHEQADKKGALQAIAATPPGLVLLWIITVGLAALVLWQLAEAIWGKRGALKTAVNVAEAAIFSVLAYSAGSIAATGGAPSVSKSFAAAVFDLPGGRYLVALGGVGLVVGGAYAVYRGIKKEFLRELDLSGAPARTAITRIGQVGWMALGFVYAVPGVLLVIAGLRYDPKAPVGLDTGLQTLADQPFGAPLLVLLAVGVAAFGIFCFVDARYRKA